MKNHIVLLMVLLAAAPFTSAHVGDAGSNEHAETIAPYPLSHAAYHGDLAEVKRLLDNGTDIKQSNEYGMTALMLATLNGQAKVAKLLLDNGANANQTNKNGRTALIVAAMWGRVETAKVLLNNGADVNQPNKYGLTALLLSLINDSEIKMAKLLLRHGANPNTKGPNGKNMWDYVKDDKSKEYLLKKALEERQ